MKEFTKSDLKDGMILTHRNGDERVLIGLKLHEECENGFKITSKLDAYLDNLISIYSNDMDIMKAWYMGKDLWERKEYVTFDKARKSGKKVKYCGDVSGFCCIKDIGFLPITYWLYELSSKARTSQDLNNAIDSPMWEIEQ